MKTTNGKQSCDKSVCDYNDFLRPRYFHGKLLDDKDFQAEQNYHAGKRRLLNRTLYGPGVVCGLDLGWKTGGTWIQVAPGVALDPEGNEIWVENTEKIEISKLLPPADATSAQPCVQQTDGTSSYYVALSYKEVATNPVPVYLPGTGCDNRTCEYSDTKEGYCLKLVKTCPQSTPPDGLLKNLCGATECSDNDKPASDCANCSGLTDAALCRCYVLEKFCEQSPQCPSLGPCGESRCVILGRIDVDSKGTVQNACANDCREDVISGRFVKYLISSTLAGVGSILSVGEKPFIDGVDFARNPIEGLCWLIRYLVLEKNSVETKGCPDLLGGSQASNQGAKIAAIDTRLSDLENKSRTEKIQVEQHLSGLQEQFNVDKAALDNRLEEISKRIPAQA